jgi:L-asparaginase
MHILFIQTGGTIDKDYPKTVKGYGFEITEASVKRILNKINTAFDYEIKSVLKKDSLDINDTDRQNLINFCRKANCDKIIITHGTDTMIETAKQLSVLKDKTIILTGAFIPERFKDSDADFNVGCAIGAIEYVPLGVYVAMNGMVYRYNEVKRNIKTGKFEKTT